MYHTLACKRCPALHAVQRKVESSHYNAASATSLSANLVLLTSSKALFVDLPYLWRVFIYMAQPLLQTSSLHFDQTSAQFVEWFTAADGTRLSPKVQLRDLRSENAGRGAGMFPAGL